MKTLILFLSLLCFCSPACAEELSAAVEKMQTAYAQMKGFRADFDQQLTQSGSGVSEQRKGSISFQKPLLLRWETASPHPELLVVTEKEIWNYLADEELAYRFSRKLVEDSRSLILVITGQSPISKDFDIEAAPEKDAGGLLHLILYPKEPSMELTEAQLWLDPTTGFIRKVLAMDFYGNTNTVELKEMKTDPAFAAEEFHFSPPEGTEVEDHTEAEHPAQKALQN